jgi:ribosomal protein L31
MWEVEIRKTKFEASPGKKFTRPYLNQWLGVVVSTCHPIYTGKHKEASLDIK